jgi:aldehyde:ferredoxin oxidoreductase
MSERWGYWGRILWVDLSERTHRLEERDDLFWRRYAGGGLVATRLLLEATEPRCDPLGHASHSLGCTLSLRNGVLGARHLDA